MIAATRRVWIAPLRRSPCDSSAVILTRCRVTRHNTACWVKVFTVNSSMKTVKWCLEIEESAASLPTCGSDLVTSNLMLSVISSFVSMVTCKEKIFYSRLLIFVFSESVEACAGCASLLTSKTSCRNLCQLFHLFDEFRVPLGSQMVGQSDYLQISSEVFNFRLQSRNFAFETASVTFVFHLSVLSFRNPGNCLSRSCRRGTLGIIEGLSS